MELVKKPSGLQHSKTMLIGSTLILGSTNWTSQSRKHHEMSLAVDLDDKGVVRYKNLVGDMRSRSFTHDDLTSAKNYLRSASPRARSADAAIKRPMPSGREEPEQEDLQLVPMLRPLALRDFPAHGAAGPKGASDAWSELANASDPDEESADSLSALPSSMPAKFVKKRVVIGKVPRSEVSFP